MSNYIFATSDEDDFIEEVNNYDDDDYPTEDADMERDFERNNPDY